VLCIDYGCVIYSVCQCKVSLFISVDTPLLYVAGSQQLLNNVTTYKTAEAVSAGFVCLSVKWCSKSACFLGMCLLFCEWFILKTGINEKSHRIDMVKMLYSITRSNFFPPVITP
jgi:uncharacterized membrane-anchored protein